MRARFLFLPLVFLIPACVPYPIGQQQGICTTDQGVVKTYDLLGVWQKVPNTDQEQRDAAEGEFKLLIFANGLSQAGEPPSEQVDGINVFFNTSVCQRVSTGRTSDNLQSATVAQFGYYFSGTNRIRSYVFPFDPTVSGGDATGDATERWVNYSFTGSCSGTQLHLDKGLVDDPPEDYNFYASAKTSTRDGVDTVAACNFTGSQ